MKTIEIKLKEENAAFLVKVSETNIEWYYNPDSNEFGLDNPKYSKTCSDSKIIAPLFKSFNLFFSKLDESIYSKKELSADKIIRIDDSKYIDIKDNKEIGGFISKMVPLIKFYIFDSSERLLDFVNSADYKKQEIDFKWNEEDNLRNVSDHSLEIALSLLQVGKYSLEYKDNKIIFNNNFKSFCTNDITTEELLPDVENCITSKMTEFKITKEITINRICIGCKFQRCPKHLAAYIHYLASTSTLEEKLEDRKKHLSDNMQYAFEWKHGDILKYIPDDLYNFCNELVNRNYIYVSRYLINDKVVIRSLYGCLDYKLSGLKIDELKPKELELEKWSLITRNPNEVVLTCDTFSCGLSGCVIFIAGVIKYLRESDRENIIQEQRKYYSENKEECDSHYNKLFEASLNIYADKIEEYINNLKTYDSPNLNKLTTILEKGRLKNLFIAIEGNDETEKTYIIRNIYNVLSKIKKIRNKSLFVISLSNLAASNAYPSSTAPVDGDVDINNVSYRTYEQIKTTVLRNEYLYVIDGIGDFIKEYRSLMSRKDVGSFISVKKKQYTHILDLLSDISYRNFVILDGTEEELNNLLSLDSRLQYIYQNNRFIIPEYPIEKTFEEFIKNLNNNLFDIVKSDMDKYKNEFLDYVSTNKSFIPFDNRELASYLAMQCNMKNELTFPEDIYKKETVDEALQNIVGLDLVKDSIKKFEKYMLFKMKAASKNLKLNDTNLHMIFTGNPGTGKTTIARIMAKMLYDMGVIKENKLIEVERKDLVAEYLGQTAAKTGEVIDKAIGGVLFIDEAYSLCQGANNDYGSEAIATLIKAMEDHKGELVVIFAGYKKEMQDFLEMNPGILSRIGYKFDFQDYTTSELMEIFYKKIGKMGFSCEKECENKLLEIFEYFSRKKSFGNGRFVDKLIQEIMMKHATRDSKKIELITVEDFPTLSELNNSNETSETTEELLKNIIGLDKLKEKIKEFENYVQFVSSARKKNIHVPNQNLHMVFVGNPGTGKTTVARIMTKILYNAGIIHDNNLVEVERKDLIAEYIGQTAIKTAKVIESALGGVLFIDEAYSLYTNGTFDYYGKEAIATLIKAMEDHKGEFVVIFAGYKKEMAEFMEANSGITSRIGYTFEFEDYTREELADILYLKINKSGLTIEEAAKEKVKTLMNYFCKVENFGNGRFVDKVFQATLMKHSKNKSKKIELLTSDDVPSVKEMTDFIFGGENMINPDDITEESLRKTAIHEVGHAFLHYKLYSETNIVKITINAEGSGALGYVQFKPEKTHVRKKSDYMKKIMTFLGGMISEEVFLGEFASGNSSDLEVATDFAKRMVTRYGMSKLGYGRISEVSGEMAVIVQKEINDILQECFEKAKAIIEENKDIMMKAVDYLYEHKEIDEEAFIKVIEGK